MHISTAIFEEAKRHLQNYFSSCRKTRNLINTLIDDMSGGHLETSLLCWQSLYAEIEGQDFSNVLRILNRVFCGRGVEFDLAVMPGSNSNVPCVTISVQSKNKIILLPLLGERNAEICRSSTRFLGTHYWMEPVVNDNPELIFRQAVNFISLDPVICPPPLTGNAGYYC